VLKDWKKILHSYFLRDEDSAGDYRWDNIDGFDAYLGRLVKE